MPHVPLRCASELGVGRERGLESRSHPLDSEQDSKCPAGAGDS